MRENVVEVELVQEDVEHVEEWMVTDTKESIDKYWDTVDALALNIDTDWLTMDCWDRTVEKDPYRMGKKSVVALWYSSYK